MLYNAKAIKIIIDNFKIPNYYRRQLKNVKLKPAAYEVTSKLTIAISCIVTIQTIELKVMRVIKRRNTHTKKHCIKKYVL